MMMRIENLASDLGSRGPWYLKILCKVLPFVSATALLLSAAAQTPTTPHPATARTADVYSVVPFDPSVETFPVGFRGNDPERVYVALKRSKLTKDEFESTEAYNRRMEALKVQPILGSLTLQSLYAFSLELFDGYNLPSDPSYSGQMVRPTYDADNGRMAISLSSTLILGSNFQLYYFRSKSSVTPRGSSIGSNVFGVTRTIRSYSYDSYCLAVPSASSELKFNFPIAPDRARAVRDRVSILLVGSLVEPYTLLDDVNGWPATIDKPFEYVFKEHQIRFNPEYVIAYDPVTGEILNREAELVVATYPDAEVFLDGESQGHADAQGEFAMQAKLGAHTLMVSLKGKKNFEQNFTLAARQVTRIEARLEDIEARLEDKVGPPPNFSIEAPPVLSDTRGVAFGPYLDRIIYIIRRNWLAVIPESARRGEMKGRTAVVLEVLKDGSVRQSRMIASSGSDPLDRAALNGVQASVPFPPLPAEFTGEHLVLQFIFLYNVQAN